MLCERAQVDILDAAEQGLEGDVDLVCRYFPEYVNQQNSVTYSTRRPSNGCEIGKTPLHFATMGNHHEMAMILLTAGADPNAAGKVSCCVGGCHQWWCSTGEHLCIEQPPTAGRIWLACF